MKDLSQIEKDFLNNHKANKKYKELCNQMADYCKNDILWALYNDLLLTYQSKKDYLNCFLVYKQMANQLYDEQKYEQGLQYFILALYVRIYEIAQECIETGLDSNFMYERHISKFHKELKKYFEKANINITDTDSLCNFVRKIVNHYLPQLEDDFWVYWLSFKYANFISNKG